MNTYFEKLTILKALEEKFGLSLFMYRDTSIKSEYLVDKKSGETLYTFHDENNIEDVNYVLDLFSLGYQNE